MNETTKRTYTATRSTSTGSISSAGIGAGLPIENQSEVAHHRENLPPNLTPEGLSVDPNIRIFDSIVYLIYCPEHDRIAVTNVERARCVWFPFVCLNEHQTWMQAARSGVDLIIGRKDAEADAEESAKKAPVYSISYLNILRIQLPPEKFITRLAMLVTLKKSPHSTFQCCQRSMRINWLRASDILADRIDKIWGPELKNFTRIVIGINERRKLITEFSLENSFYHYFTKENSVEKKLLKASHIKPEHIAEIYENFVEHCYPSFYMSFESFKHYLIKYGFDRNDSRMAFLFRACSLYDNDFLHFHEVLLGIIAMEPTTKHFTEGRLNFLFKYYDTSNNGFLKLEEFIVMVTDIHKYSSNTSLNEENLKTEIEKAIRCVGMKDERIAKDNLIKAVLNNSFKNTENLCRSPKPILPQISRLMQTKTTEKSGSSSSAEGFLVANRRSKKGTCIKCRDQHYEYCLHCVTFDTVGRCVAPTLISEQWIEPALDNEMNQHKYSMDYTFNNSSVPNIFIDLIKDFYNKTKIEGNQQLIGLMAVREDWKIFSRYVNILCEELKGLLISEDKLIKINSPAIVVGDMQGNLIDLFTLEKTYFQGFPVTPYNLVFLGNYSGIGSYGVEMITYLFSLKLLLPNKVFLLRGTNEIKSKSRRILLSECLHKYGPDFGQKIFAVITEIFARLPFAVIIDENIFCCHSGIPKWNKLDKINQLGHDVFSVLKEAPIAYELLVNTPLGMDECLCSMVTTKESSGNSKSMKRSSLDSKSSKKMAHKKLGANLVIGVTGFTASEHSDFVNSCSYDHQAFQNFMRSYNFQYLIRSHSLQTSNDDGFDLHYSNRCISIFSCSKPKSSRSTVAFVDGSNQRIRLLSFERETAIITPVESIIHK
ncbi:hypothetical protein DERF_003107 [Dermatophagoides farinae]|nr:hypothetical protein DERF_003107 [Dermatophagoides farinae]